jgi:homoserine kinase type II
LIRKGIPCPRPKRTLEGRATSRAAARLVAVVSFLPGSSSVIASPAKCLSVGRVMAQIHTGLERKARHKSVDLQIGPVHGALSQENVFFLRSEVSGVINFRLRHDDLLVSEIADVLVAWTGEPNGELNKVRARAILQGYGEVRDLSGDEIKALPAFVMAATSKRFACRKQESGLPEAAMMAYRSVTTDVLR